MNIWKRILRGIDVWIEKQLDEDDYQQPQQWHPPHTVIHDVKVSRDTKTQPNKVKRALNKTHKSLAENWSNNMPKPQFEIPEKVTNFISPFIEKMKHTHRTHKKLSRGKRMRQKLAWLIGGGLVLALFMVGILLIYIAGLKIPTFDEFVDREIASSTKIYDRTGEILLFDVHEGVSRTVVPLEEISPNIVNALIAIEDDQFYEHNGVDFKATMRAILYTGLSKVGLRQGGTQGGSTLTQQVLKNTLLTSERTFKRKMKEWFLALRLEKTLTKDEILQNYLNEAPYGGSIYGVETAAQAFFAKSAAEVTIAESAYLAAIPNAPTFFSPYGNNIDRLEARKNTVLRLMNNFDLITETDYQDALVEEVEFRPRTDGYSKAIHFVEYVRQELVKKYGQDMVENGGLRVITTLDYELQEAAEEIIARNALINEDNWNASNSALVAIDPTTGGILTMVGSRGYSDPDIDGKFNVALAKRQPGSSFKPFVYATGLAKGYTDQTVLFDTQTQFTPSCTLTQGSTGNCYRPGNYDGLFKGPLTMRNALAQSRNIPAVKMLYLVGVRNAIQTASSLGITGLRDANFYGLTLVLGGGEVRLLDITSAYGVFANDGVRFEHNPILEVYDDNNELLEEYVPTGEVVLDPEVARTISSILSDNQARAPLFGLNSSLNFGGRYDVAAKTGTTNDSRDGWLIGYSPSVVTGVWSGNNDNSSMSKGSTVSAPAWKEFMEVALASVPNRRFIPPTPQPTDLKPVLRGIWQGNDTIVVDSVSGKLATEFTPQETREEIVIPEAHTILHWVDTRDPRGPAPSPITDGQYRNWEQSVQSWLLTNPVTNGGNLSFTQLSNLLELIGNDDSGNLPYDDVHIPEKFPNITNLSISPIGADLFTEITVQPTTSSVYPIQSVEYYLDNVYIGVSEFSPFDLSFIPQQTEAYVPGRTEYTLRAVAIDQVYNRNETEIEITIEE